MKKILSVLSLVALMGLAATPISYAEDLPAAAAATVEAVADTAAAVAEAVPAPEAVTAVAPAEAAPAEAAPAPSANKGDTAWMLISTVLVTLMVIPGLALFYGGLVRQKNMLSVLMQVFVIFSLMGVLWAALLKRF